MGYFGFTWLESQDECSKRDMILVEIKTKDKFLELTKLIEKVVDKNEGKYLWTGGIREKLPVENFVWHSTGEKFTYSNWFNCLSKSGFVCEYSNENHIQQQLQIEIEKNLQLQNELNNQKQEYEEQLQNLKEQNLQEQDELNENLKAEIVKQENLKQMLKSQEEQIKQLSDQKTELIEQLAMELKKTRNFRAGNG
ncbi:hypothetical protein FF38_10415 [Lucilia cuprina]|uniref:C-type lectin domain-containing protein n=1 Tax=Lucilia cuprina TaxID=7375 RepID=A0A0L0BST3_LUCCU|nr:hypothetical protein FF38_10415 [Lucilia cuprina]